MAVAQEVITESPEPRFPTFRDLMVTEWHELARWRDLLRHTVDNHNGASQDDQDRLLTIAEAVTARLDTFIEFLDEEFYDD